MILFVEKITLKNKTNKQTNINLYDVLMQKGKCGFVDEFIKHLSRQIIRLVWFGFVMVFNTTFINISVIS